MQTLVHSPGHVCGDHWAALQQWGCSFLSARGRAPQVTPPWKEKEGGLIKNWEVSQKREDPAFGFSRLHESGGDWNTAPQGGLGKGQVCGCLWRCDSQPILSASFQHEERRPDPRAGVGTGGCPPQPLDRDTQPGAPLWDSEEQACLEFGRRWMCPEEANTKLWLC